MAWTRSLVNSILDTSQFLGSTMSSTLSHALVPKLRLSFDDIAMTIYPDNHKIAVFTAAHREIGDFIL